MKFPKQIQDRIARGMGCGSGIGPGWMGLVVELDAKLAELHSDYVIDQIKEKFGSLRFYATGVGEDGQKLIHEAEVKSAEICEDCGQPGKSRSGGWVRTLCDKHANK